MRAPIRVVVIEDHPVLRSLIRTRLAAEAGIDVVGEGATGAEAIWLVHSRRPDVLVLDIELGGELDGVDVTARVGDACHVLAVSAHSDPVHVAHLLLAGAAGYLSKEAPPEGLVEAVRSVAAGQSRWFGVAPHAPVALTADAQGALRAAASGVMPASEPLADALGALGASSWYEALAKGWALGLVAPVRPTASGQGREPSTRAKVPGQASSASAGSYGA